MFAENGIPVIDADKIGHLILEPGGAAVDAVVDAFGADVQTDGTIDRGKLAKRVFGDPESLARLNGLTHPAVGMEIARQAAALAGAGHKIVLVEAALHAENGKLGPGIEELVLVTCPREERVRRLTVSRGMTVDEANARIEAQKPPEAKIPLARWIVDNAGSTNDLRSRVAEVAGELLAWK